MTNTPPAVSFFRPKSEVGGSVMRERRREGRYPAAIPVDIEGLRSVTRDVSPHGVGFHDSLPLPVGAPVEFFIELGTVGSFGTRLCCRGRVVRADGGFAATIDRFDIVPMIGRTPEKPPVSS